MDRVIGWPHARASWCPHLDLFRNPRNPRTIPTYGGASREAPSDDLADEIVRRPGFSRAVAAHASQGTPKSCQNEVRRDKYANAKLRFSECADRGGYIYLVRARGVQRKQWGNRGSRSCGPGWEGGGDGRGGGRGSDRRHGSFGYAWRNGACGAGGAQRRSWRAGSGSGGGSNGRAARRVHAVE